MRKRCVLVYLLIFITFISILTQVVRTPSVSREVSGGKDYVLNIQKLETIVDPKAWKDNPWFNASERYFLYQPSGGISNQLLILESALLICRYLQRICILPPIAPHTRYDVNFCNEAFNSLVLASGWWNYNGVLQSDVLSTEYVLDIASLRQVAPIITLNVTLKRFILQYEDKLGRWKRLNKCPQCTISKIYSLYNNQDANILLFGRTSMWQWGRLAKGYQFTASDMRLVENSIRPFPDLRRIARIISNSLVPYLALHIRFLDDDNDPRAKFKRAEGKNLYYKFPLRSPNWFIRELRQGVARKKYVMRNPQNLFIATAPKEKKSPFFNEIKRNFNVTFSDVIEQTQMLQNYYLRYIVPEKLKGSMLGIIEQLICARAEVFLGTSYSSFSASIRRMRRNRVSIVDSEVPSRQELSIISAQTECREKFRAC